MKNLIIFLDNLSNGTILLVILGIVFILLILWLMGKSSRYYSKHDESHARTRYEKTAELDEMLKRRRK